MSRLLAVSLSALAGIGVALLGLTLSSFAHSDQLFYLSIFLAIAITLITYGLLSDWLGSQPIKRAVKHQTAKNAATKKAKRNAYAVAEKEVTESRVDEGTWAEALIKADGIEQIRKVKYMELRAQQLLDDASTKNQSKD